MNWRKQIAEPLFPDLIWSRPENKRHAGKLLIIGGQAGEFSQVGAAFEAASEAGAGSIRILLPESLRKAAQMIPEVEFAPSNHSGSFAKSSLGGWFDLADWADHVLLAGDLGKNSETTTIIDGFLLRGISPMTLNLNSLASTGINVGQLLKLPLTLVIDRGLLQKIGTAIGMTTPILSTAPVDKLAETIQDISAGNKANLVIQDEGMIWSAVNGELIGTKSKESDNAYLAATCAVWLMQNPKKPLEALATAVFELSGS